MALRLGMSRTPVHEAIIRLQEEGMVRVLAKRGRDGLPALRPADVREIYEVTIAIEAMAAEVDRRTPANRRAEVVRGALRSDRPHG